MAAGFRADTSRPLKHGENQADLQRVAAASEDGIGPESVLNGSGGKLCRRQERAEAWQDGWRRSHRSKPVVLTEDVRNQADRPDLHRLESVGVRLGERRMPICGYCDAALPRDAGPVARCTTRRLPDGDEAPGACRWPTRFLPAVRLLRELHGMALVTGTVAHRSRRVGRPVRYTHVVIHTVPMHVRPSAGQTRRQVVHSPAKDDRQRRPLGTAAGCRNAPIKRICALRQARRSKR